MDSVVSDLPVLMNQWNSVVRWSCARNSSCARWSFLARGAHGTRTREEAEAETRQMLDIYTDFAVNDAAIPVIPAKSPTPRSLPAPMSPTLSKP